MRQLKQYPTDEVQGKGSWVKMRRPTIEQLMGIMEMQEATDDMTALSEVVTLLDGLLVDWNWEDEQGKALAKPGNGVSLTTLATDDEMFFLSKLIGEQAQEARQDAKKKPTRSRRPSSSKAGAKKRRG